MKNLIKLLVILFLFGCNAQKEAEKKFQKAVNKFGQKEAAKFITEKYPEYFIVKKDSVKDSIITKGIDIDTSLTLEALHDTIVITKDRVTVKEVYRNGKVFTSVKQAPDTVFKWLPCPEVKVPDVVKLNLGTKQEKDFNWWIVVAVVSLILFIIALVKRK